MRGILGMAGRDSATPNGTLQRVMRHIDDDFTRFSVRTGRDSAVGQNARMPAPSSPKLLPPSTLLRVSVLVAVITIAMKTLAWYITGSVGLLSDAMESFVNLASALFALQMVTVAQRPADDEHPYGHHKAEYFSSGFEGILIAGAAAGIVWASVHRLLHPQPLEQLGWGLVLSVGSSALNGALAWLMFRSARAYRSIALEGDARHLVTDVWTSAGVVAGLAAVTMTGWQWLDPLIGIGVALNILREGGRLVWQSSQGLMDEALEPEVLADIERVLHGFSHGTGQAGGTGVPSPSPSASVRAGLGRPGAALMRFDHLTTRRAGQRRFADLHLHLPASWPLGRAAAVRGEVEGALMHAVPGLRVTIQLLPSNVEALATDPTLQPKSTEGLPE